MPQIATASEEALFITQSPFDQIGPSGVRAQQYGMSCLRANSHCLSTVMCQCPDSLPHRSTYDPLQHNLLKHSRDRRMRNLGFYAAPPFDLTASPMLIRRRNL